MNDIERIAKKIAEGWRRIESEGPSGERQVARVVGTIEKFGAEPIYRKAVEFYRAEAAR